jgi:hypothetical protein
MTEITISIIFILIVSAILGINACTGSSLDEFQQGIPPQDVVNKLSSHEWCLLVVGPKGRIVDIKGYEAVPTVEEMKDAAQHYKGLGAVILKRGDISSVEALKRKVEEIVRGLELNRSGKLKDGINVVK